MSQRTERRKRTIWRNLLLTSALGGLVLAGCTNAIATSPSATQTGQPTTDVVANVAQASTTTQEVTAKPVSASIAQIQASTVEAKQAVTAAIASADEATSIALGETITVNGPGATVEGTTVKVSAGGTYRISGTLDDGQFVVDAGDEATANLILDGADITSASSAPIYILNAGSVVVVLADGTENSLTDGAAYDLADAESNQPNAALFSKANLIIGGNGSLTVDANYDHGIVSKDGLTFTGGNIAVTAPTDGIRGRDFVVVGDGKVTVNAQSDGLQANNDEDLEKGYVVVEDGTVVITAGQDGIQAATSVLVKGGDLNLTTGGGSANTVTRVDQGPPGRTTVAATADAGPTAKGIQAGANLTIEGGTINVDSADDSLHSNGSLTIGGGTLVMSSGDDAIHADTSITIDGGEISIAQAYEGIEGAAITINGGNIHVVASDDAVNVAGGTDGSALGGRPGPNAFTASTNQYLHVNGGYMYVDASGDGVDVNGKVEMSGGTLIVNGPTANNNGALDYDGGFTISGGTVVAVGSAGMAQAPDTSSSQYSLLVNFPSVQAPGTLVHIQDEAGEAVLTFAPTKAFQSVAVSSPAFKNGTSYTVYTGGSTSGTATDGLYSGGAYTGGTQSASLAVSGVVTTSGTTGRFSGGRAVPGGVRP